MNRELKCLLIVAGVVMVAYLINRYSTNNIINNPNPSEQVESFSAVNDIPLDTSSDAYSSESTIPSVSMSASQKNSILHKYNSKNKAKNGTYKRSNYSDGDRDQSDQQLAAFFDDNNSLVKDGQLANDEYANNDETGGKFANYTTGPKVATTDDDLFNADNFLPKDTNQDWFEVMPEPISIKNRHLINVSRPIGVNTVGNSLRNPSYDVRGTPPCPKFVVSPWMQSTIEPDYNIKGLC